MIRLQTNLIRPGCAQGEYTIKAKGYILAVLSWGIRDCMLNNWGPFAYVPIDPAGNGSFFFSGSRSIPQEATHLWARCYSSDFSAFDDVSAEIPSNYLLRSVVPESAAHFSILSDLHLSSRPWKINRALKSAESEILFLLGDSTNDGTKEQFDRFEECIAQTISEKIIFPVTGNHDVPHPSRASATDSCCSYSAFQNRLLEKAADRGYRISFAPDQRAYSLQTADLDIIALQCVTEGRRFLFPEGIQIDWLEDRLSSSSASWHIILCHAPMLAHNPNRNDGPPYLDKNRRLQELLDRHGRIIFFSGHTHVSPNVLTGNAEYDERHQNIYLDCASVVSTDTSGEAGLMSSDWKDGCRTELRISGDTVEICMYSVDSGIRFPRGYYRFHANAENSGK